MKHGKLPLIAGLLLIFVGLPLLTLFLHSDPTSESQMLQSVQEKLVEGTLEETSNTYASEITHYTGFLTTNKAYDDTEKLATVTDTETSLEVKAKLLTPQVFYVPVGYQKVAEFELETNKELTRPITDLELYTKKDMQLLNRKVDYKYWQRTGEKVYGIGSKTCELVCEVTPYEVNVPSYDYYDNKTSKTITVPESTRQETSRTCEEVCTPSHETKTEEVGEWKAFDNMKELPPGKVRIGLFMKVEKDDYLEWIPTIAGSRIPEWATIQEGSWRGTQWYYSFNESNGNELPELTEYNSNGSNKESSNWTSGKLGNSLNYTGELHTELGNYSNTADFSYSFWLRPNTLSQTDGAGIFWGNTEEFGLKINDTDKVFLTTGGINLYADTFASGNFTVNNWTHLAVTSNSSTVRYYRDGVLISQATGTTSSGNRNMTFARISTTSSLEDNEGVNVTMGGTPATNPCSGMRFTVDGTAINVVQVEKYAGNAATTVCVADSSAACLGQQNATYSGNFATFSPPIALPSSGTYEILNYGSFTSKFANAGGYPKVRDYITWIGSRSTACGIDTTNAFDFAAMTISVASETNNYLDAGLDEFGFWNRTLSDAEVTALAQGISYGADFGTSATLNTPPTNNYTNSAAVTFNCSATDTIGTLTNLTHIIDGVGNFSTNPAASSGSLERTVTLTEGTHTWTCNVTGTYTAQPSATNFTIDLTDPVLNITNPPETHNVTLSIPVNITINWTVSDANPVTSFVSYNGSNFSGLSNGLNFGVGAGINHIRVYANDSSGREVFSTANITVYHLNLTTQYPGALNSLASGAFNLTVGYNDSLISDLSAAFEYNDTEYATTETAVTSNITRFSNTPTAPFVTSNVNKSFSWNLTLTPSDSSADQLQFLNFSNQVTSINVTTCVNPAAGQDILVNFSAYNEINTTSLTFDMNGYFTIWTGDPAVNGTVSVSETGSTTVNLCANGNNQTMYVSGDLEYFATGFDLRNWFVRTLGVNTSIDKKFVRMYLVDEIESQVTRFIVTDDTETPLPGRKIHAQRKDQSTGTFFTVAMAGTDTQGEAYFPMEWYDATYKFAVYDPTNALEFTSSETVLQTTPVYIRITEGSVIEKLDTFDNMAATLTFDNTTKAFTFTYNDATGSIRKMCLDVKRVSTYISNVTVCKECQEATSGTITCTVGDNLGVYTAIAYAEQNPSGIIMTAVWENLQDLGQTLGVSGIAYSLIILLALILMFSYSPTTTVVAAGLGMAIVGFLGLASLPYMAVAGIIIAGVVAVGVMRS